MKVVVLRDRAATRTRRWLVARRITMRVGSVVVVDVLADVLADVRRFAGRGTSKSSRTVVVVTLRRLERARPAARPSPSSAPKLPRVNVTVLLTWAIDTCGAATIAATPRTKPAILADQERDNPSRFKDLPGRRERVPTRSIVHTPQLYSDTSAPAGCECAGHEPKSGRGGPLFPIYWRDQPN